jgi:hypothetical protein
MSLARALPSLLARFRGPAILSPSRGPAGRFENRWRVLLGRALAALLVLGFVAVDGANGQACDPTLVNKFKGTEEWRGSFTIKGTATGTDGTTVYTVSESIAAKPDLLPTTGGLVPKGPMNEVINVDDQAQDPTTGSFVEFKELNGNQAVSSGPFGAGFMILFSGSDCTYSLVYDQSYNATVTLESQTFDEIGQFGPLLDPNGLGGPGAVVSVVPLPTDSLVLAGKLDFHEPPATPVTTDPVHWVITWTFAPKIQNVDLVLTPDGYDGWRPTGGRKETDPGSDPILGGSNVLRVNAALKTTDGTQLNVEANDITFKLTSVSHVPGVVGNWPPKGSATTAADLTFDQSGGSTGAVSSDGLTVTSPANVTEFGSVIVPHDWGAYGVLQATADLPDGSTITGYLVTDPSVTNVLVPKRQQNSHIADSWKDLHNISLDTPDADDSDNDPVGDGQLGDGLTLYEEYRGFYMGCSGNNYPIGLEAAVGGTCQHVEGDPQKKDLFIVQTLTAMTDLGIEMFKKQTDIRTHYHGLHKDEISPTRVINFNNDGGAHEVDQHALLIVRTSEAKNYAEAVGGPGLPRDVTEIDVPESMDASSAPAGPERDEYMSVIAHEISHAVDVWHHGENDRGDAVWSVDENGAIQETLMFEGAILIGTSTPVYVITEDTDLSAQVINLVSPSSLLLDQTDEYLWVGNNKCGTSVERNGQHSGDEACWMRYNAAGAYIPSGLPDFRVLVDEFAGFQLTDHAGGTGVNDPNRLPRSRYGDAYSNRGECSKQICVNDAGVAVQRDQPEGCSQ